MPFARLPAATLREFEKAAKCDWERGVSINELLDRVNRVAMSFLPEEDRWSSRVGRVKRIFTERSLRHYQTLHAIDVPEKHGRMAVYGFRQFVQALLIRRLLWDGVGADQIVTLMVGRGTEETRAMFLQGVEFVARPGAGTSVAESARATTSVTAETWKRIEVVPGVELHIHGGLPKPKPAELRHWLERIENALRRNL